MNRNITMNLCVSMDERLEENRYTVLTADAISCSLSAVVPYSPLEGIVQTEAYYIARVVTILISNVYTTEIIVDKKCCLKSFFAFRRYVAR